MKILFKDLFQKSKVNAKNDRLGYFNTVVYKNNLLQLLALTESKDDHRDFELERKRLEEKPLVYKKIEATLFCEDTFTPKETFEGFRKNARTVYPSVEWESYPMT